ncbi:hypothetical protein [Kitasatospora sp. NBC_00315]|uniref:hypothetical protein n=1 Tax=Kitasatospora sp. NBC_00315 TaxID=2975963 RepID=UPI0032470EF2
MNTVEVDGAVRPGDYLRVASHRWTAGRLPRDEGYARVEQIEHITDLSFLTEESREMATMPGGGVAVVFCQGLPGPVLLGAGDQWLLKQISAQRLAWDETHPTWPSRSAPFFRDAILPEGEHRLRRSQVGPTPIPPEQRVPLEATPAPAPRATTFSKPASALTTGDYLQTHAHRHTPDGMASDEGFHRIEHVTHLRGEPLNRLLTTPEWAGGTLILVSVHGLSGTLLLADGPVTVQVQPNPERQRGDEEQHWSSGPYHDLTDTTEPDPARQRATDEQLRPATPDGELDLYPSLISDPFQRELHMRGTSGVRPVPVAALPWPSRLHKCLYEQRGKAIAETYPDADGARQAASAEQFATTTPAEFAACPYHQGDDWTAIADTALTVARALTEAERDAADDKVHKLTERDQQWALALASPGRAINWDDGDTFLTDGQHRLCALRAAGVTSIPVYGCYLPDRPQTAVGTAQQHARQTITDFWYRQAAAVLGPNKAAAALARLLRRFPARRNLLPSSAANRT